MALIFTDGFDEYSNSLQMLDSLTTTAYWSGTTSRATSSTIFRTTQVSGTSRSLDSRLVGSTLAVPAQTEYIVGVGFYYDSAASTENFLELRNSAGNGIRIQRSSAEALSAIRISGGTVLGTSATGVLSTSAWRYIEVRVKIHATAGEVQIRVEGSDVLNLTGLDTTTGSVADISRIYLYHSNSSNAYFDDLYVCDTTGATNNAFLGPIGVYTLVPNGAGSSTQYTPSGAASNWDCVNELGGPDTTTYVTTSTGGQVDSYATENLPITPASIAGVMLSGRSMKTDSGARSQKLRCTVGGDTASGSAQVLLTNSWGYGRSVFETQPNGSAWSKAAVDSMEIGVESV